MSRCVGEILRVGIGGALTLMVGRAFCVMGLVLPCRVASESMEPTVRAGDRVVVDRTAFWFRAPRRWEIIVFRCPDMPHELCVKRVAGLPGERLKIREGVVYVNDEEFTPPVQVRYGARSGQEFGDSPEYFLGPSEYFVLGDNPMVSVDSRSWEPPAIKDGWIVGRSLRSGQ
jgi:signal peptidase I